MYIYNKTKVTSMAFGIYIILFLLSLAFPKNRILFFINFLFMWVLFGWSGNNADMEVYVNRYTNYNAIDSYTEPLYTFLISISHYVGFSLRDHLIFVSFIYLSTIFFFISKATKKVNYVLAFYQFSTVFFMDIVQVRNTIAILFIFIGLFFLLFRKGEKSIYLYVLCVFLASMIHFSAICYLLFIFARFFDIKRIVIVCVVFLLIYFLMHTYIGTFISGIAILGDKMSRVSEFVAENYLGTNIQRISILRIIMVTGMYFGIFLLEKKNTRKQYIEENGAVLTLFKINILVYCIIPLLWVSTDFYRIAMALLLPNLCVIFEYMFKKNKSIKFLILFFCCSALAFLLVFMGKNIDTVFYAILEKNILIK